MYPYIYFGTFTSGLLLLPSANLTIVRFPSNTFRSAQASNLFCWESRLAIICAYALRLCLKHGAEFCKVPSPTLSLEITKECPLRCPGCYAYEDAHLGATNLRSLSDFKGDELISRVLGLAEKYKPMHLSIVGGDPLVRYRELEVLLPQLVKSMKVQVVTSAFRQIPVAWAALPNLQISVSIDGLQPEHDVRRAPATYERIIKNIEGQHATVHCTITSAMVKRDGYIDEFVDFWSANPNVEKIWMSIFTPQRGAKDPEILSRRRTRQCCEYSVASARKQAETGHACAGDS